MVNKNNVNYEKIYDYLRTCSGKITTASGIAYFTGHDRIYGGTMSKLVRDGALAPCPHKGYYRVVI